MQPTPERAFNLHHFKAICRAIADYDSLDMLIQHMTEGLCRTFAIQGASILLHDEREKCLFHVGSYGISEGYLAKGPVAVSYEHDAIFLNQPVLIEDLQHDPRVQYPEAAVAEKLTSMLSIPMKYHGTLIGIVRLYHHQPIRLHEEDLDSVCVLSELLGLVVENNGFRNFIENVIYSMGRLPLHMLKGLS